MEQFNLGEQNSEHNKISSFSAGPENFKINLKEELAKLNEEIKELEDSLSLGNSNQNPLSKVFLRLGIGNKESRNRLDSLYKNRHSLENKARMFENSQQTKETLH